MTSYEMGDVLFIDGAIWSIGMVHACLSPFETAVSTPIFLIIVGVQKNLMQGDKTSKW